MKETRTSSTIKNLFWAFIGQGIGLIISFISRIFFLKILGSEYLGLNGLFTNILTVLSLAELGIGTAIIYSLYRPLAVKDELKIKQLMFFYKKTYIIIGIIILILGIAITPFLKYLINDIPNIDYIWLIYILFVINTSVSYFYSYKRNLIIADQNRYIATIYRYLFYILLNITQIIYLVITKDYFGFLVLQIIFTILENIFVSKKADEMYPFLKDKRKYTLDKETKIELFKNTKAMMMHKIGTVVVNSTDNIVLSSFVGLTAVGLYSNYYLVIYALTLITDQLYNSVKSSIGNLYAIEDSNKSYDIFKKLDFLTFWISACCTCCMISLYNPFITIWVGEQYLFSMDIVIAIVINFYLKLMRKSILSFREAAGLFYKDRWKPILESVVNLVVSIILAKKIGTLGVFIGTIVSYVFICIWVEVYVLYRYGFKKSIKIYFKNYFIELTIVIILCLLTFSACYLIPQAGLVGFVIKVIICFCIPNVILYFVYRNSNEFKYFKKLFFKIFKKLNHINIKHSIN